MMRSPVSSSSPKSTSSVILRTPRTSRLQRNRLLISTQIFFGEQDFRVPHDSARRPSFNPPRSSESKPTVVLNVSKAASSEYVSEDRA